MAPAGVISLGGLRDMSSTVTLAQGAAGVPNYLSGSSPGRLERRVLSEERGKCYSPRPFCGYSRATPRGASHYLNCRRCQEEEEEGLFKADAVNEEDPERDRATQV